MSKISLSKDQYLAVLNEKLKEHQDFEAGMEIIGVPKGGLGSDLSGYAWKGPDLKISKNCFANGLWHS